jgi:hypothetical protein
MANNEISAGHGPQVAPSSLGLPLKILLAVSIIGVAAVCFLLAATDVSFQGTNRFWLSLLAAAYIYAAGLLVFWAFRGRWQWSVMILLVAMASLFAFGLQAEQHPNMGRAFRLHLDVPDLATILVLFLLSELAVSLFYHADAIANSLRTTEQNLRGTATDVESHLSNIQRELNSQNFRDVVSRLDRAAQVFMVIHDLPRPVGDKLKKSLANLGEAWSKVLPSLGVGQDQDPLLNTFWAAFLERYFREEVRDAERAQIATNENFYFDFLENAVSALEELGSTQHLVFRGVTVLLTQDWYNWPNEDSSSRQTLANMESYRHKVESIIQKAGTTGHQYARLVVVTKEDKTGNYHGRYRIPRVEDLLKEEDLMILSFPRPGEDPKSCTFRNFALEPAHYAAMVKALKLNTPALPDGAAYLIVESAKLQDAGIRFPTKGAPALEIGIPAIVPQQRVIIENLVSRYVQDLHSQPELAQHITLPDFVLEDYLEKNGPNLDQWHLGVKDTSGAVQWRIVVSTTMRPGFQTLLLDVKCGQDAARIAKWWDDNIQYQKRWV